VVGVLNILHLDVIRHGVGLRQLREGGARVEKERIEGTWVVHDYDHGGAGYQSSYGCSQEVVRLVGEAFAEVRGCRHPFFCAE
jgi:D-amino-acid oxidase